MRSAQVNDLSTEAEKHSCNIWLIAWIIQTPGASKVLKDWKASLCQSQPLIWCHDSHNQYFSQMMTHEVPCWAHPWQNHCQSPSWKELKPCKVHSMRYCLETHYAKNWVDSLLLARLSKPASISVHSTSMMFTEPPLRSTLSCEHELALLEFDAWSSQANIQSSNYWELDQASSSQ